MERGTAASSVKGFKEVSFYKKQKRENHRETIFKICFLKLRVLNTLQRNEGATIKFLIEKNGA